jgi:hypothetical protein
MGGPRVRLLALVLVADVLSGCATGPASPTLDAEAKRFQARADTACIYIVPSNSATAVAVLLDGRTVATLEDATYLRLEVPPGQHVLAVSRSSLLPTVLRETPETLPVEAEAGQCYFLRALWREEEGSGRSYRVYLARVPAAEGEREIAIRRLILPRK